MNCLYCKKIYSGESIWSYCVHIDDHLMKLNGHKIFHCSFCSKSFGTKNSFYVHLRDQHFEGKNFIPQTSFPIENGSTSLCDTNEINPVRSEFLSSVNSSLIVNEELENVVASPQNLPQDLQKRFTNLILKFLNHDSMTRKLCFEIFNAVFSEFEPIFKLIFAELGNTGMSQNLKSIENYFESDTLKFSEHKFFKQLDQAGILIPYYKQVLKVNSSIKSLNSGTSIVSEEYFYYYFDLFKLLTKLFSSTEFLIPFFDYFDLINKKDPNEVKNILNTKFWKEKLAKLPSDMATLYLPISLFYDDCETLNPLGSHNGAYAIGDCFFKILCLPPHLSSKLDLIFPTQRIQSNLIY